jgi:hypothetical protein
MRLLVSCLTAASLALPATIVWSAQPELAPGFEIATNSISKEALLRLDSWRLQRKGDATSAPIELIVVTLDKKTKARIQPVLQQGSASSLYAPELCPGALIVANGSFYTRSGEKTEPLGLVRIAGKTLAKPSERRSGGFLIINNGRVQILPRSASARALTAEDAIESTPIVVKGGTTDMRSDDRVRFDRVGVGTISKGRTVVIGAFADDQDSISLYEFSVLARAAVATTGARLKDFLSMDGGPSAHIYLPVGNRLFGYRGPAFLPNAICIDPQ